jgi:hypothetical protein
MYALLASEEFNELHSYLVCKSLSVSTSIPVPKIVVTEMGAKHKIVILSQTPGTIFYVFHKFMETITINKSV